MASAVQPLIDKLQRIRSAPREVVDAINHGRYIEPLWQMLGIDKAPQVTTPAMLPPFEPNPEQQRQIEREQFPPRPMRMSR